MFGVFNDYRNFPANKQNVFFLLALFHVNWPLSFFVAYHSDSILKIDLIENVPIGVILCGSFRSPILGRHFILCVAPEHREWSI